MHVTVNGEPARLPSAATVAELIRQLQFEGRIAVEINQQVVPRSQWALHALAEGDAVEVVQAIGGG